MDWTSFVTNWPWRPSQRAAKFRNLQSDMLMRTLLGFCLMAVLPPTLVGQQMVLLRIAPPVGQTSTYRVETTTAVDVSGTSRLTTGFLMIMSQVVTDADGDMRTVEITMDSVAVSGGMPVMAQAAQQMRGLRSVLRMDTRGRVIEAILPDSLVGLIPGGAPGGANQGLAELLLPEAAVEPGDVWRDTSTTALDNDNATVNLKKDLQYRLERVELREGARYAIISITGTINTRVEAPGANGFSMVSQGSMRGELEIDLDAGRWVRNETEMSMLTESPTMPMPASVTVTITGRLISP
jgi:hypothetical protein